MDTATFESILDEIQALEAQTGIDMNELINVSDGLRQVLVWMIRTNGFQLGDLEEFLEQSPPQVQRLLDGLTAKNMVEEMKAEHKYFAQVVSSRVERKYRIAPDFWKAFD